MDRRPSTGEEGEKQKRRKEKANGSAETEEIPVVICTPQSAAIIAGPSLLVLDYVHFQSI